MAKAAGSSLAKKGMANATLQKVVENKFKKKLQEKIGGDGTIEGLRKDIPELGNILYSGIENRVKGLADGSLYANKLEQSLTPYTIIKDAVQNKDDSDLNLGQRLFPLATHLFNKDKYNPSQLAILRTEYANNKDKLDENFNKEVASADRKFKLKKRGIFG